MDKGEKELGNWKSDHTRETPNRLDEGDPFKPLFLLT